MAKDDDLTQIKELLEIVKHKVDMMEVSRTGQSATLQLIKDQQSVINGKIDRLANRLDDSDSGLEAINKTLNSNSASLLTIEKEIRSYADSYQINQHNIERLDTRVSTVEKKLDIKPPEELSVPHFSE
ncbi:MAG: hypothetical protein V1808_01395 [Candidatus Daviesbacteria bacterium]